MIVNLITLFHALGAMRRGFLGSNFVYLCTSAKLALVEKAARDRVTKTNFGLPDANQSQTREWSLAIQQRLNCPP